LFGLVFGPEDGSDMFLLSLNYAVLQSRNYTLHSHHSEKLKSNKIVVDTEIGVFQIDTEYWWLRMEALEISQSNVLILNAKAMIYGPISSHYKHMDIKTSNFPTVLTFDYLKTSIF
jgi:hypothetical protein